MKSLGLSGPQLELALGAARAVAFSDGGLEVNEQRALHAIARMFGFEGDVEALPSPSPAEIRDAFPEERSRARIIEALLVVALTDGAIARSEIDLIRAYASALSVDELSLESMRHLANSHRRLVYFDLWRRSGANERAESATWEKKGTRGLWSFFGGFTGLERDAEIAWRYKSLGLLAEGTFGRAYWVHMTSRRYAFPGEESAFPEELLKYDLVHVLGGYDTDPASECEVVAFISGFMKTDPFGLLLQTLLHREVGGRLGENEPVDRVGLPLTRVGVALERGRRVTTDLCSPSWDPWADLPLPLEEIRAKYAIA